MLKPEDRHYLPDFKISLIEMMESQFGIGSLNTDGPDISARRLSVYSLCRTFLIQQSLAAEAEYYRCLGRLYGGLMQICRLGGTVSGLVTLKHFVLMVLPSFAIFVPVTGFLAYEEIELTSGLILAVLAVLALRPIQANVKRYSEAEVDSVYYGFYTWHKTRMIEPAHA